MNDTDGQPSNSAQRRPLVAVTALAALIPVVPIVIGILLTSASGGSAAVPTNSAFRPVTQAPAAPPSTPAAGPASTLVPAGPGVLVATVTRATTMHKSPAGPRLAPQPLRTIFGSPVVMWVVKVEPGWLGVVSPLAGNGRLGWIPESSATLARDAWQIHVSLAARQVTVSDNGKVRERYTVAVGAPYAPTPTGRFAVTDRLLTGDPQGPYGCCILALSAEAPHAIQDWSGGNRIAIHSTPDTSSIGQPVSHGCMRLTLPEGQWLITHVPLGTPTLIDST